MGKYFPDYIYFEDESENESFTKYIYTRNSQLYDFLQKGMTYSEASDLFDLTKNAIKARYKTYRHKFNVPDQTGKL